MSASTAAGPAVLPGALGGAMRAIGRRPLAWCVAVLAASVSLAALLLAAGSAQALWPWISQGGLPAQATVVLAPGTADSDALRASLSRVAGVASIGFVSRDAALARLAARSAADRDAIAQLAVNPLPDSYVIEFRPDAEAADIEAGAAVIRKLPRVDTVQLDLGWYRKLRAGIRLGSVAVQAVLALVAAHALLWLLAAIALCAHVDVHRARILSLLGADARAIGAAAGWGGMVTALAVAAVSIGLARLGAGWLDARVAETAALYGRTLRLPWPDTQTLAAGALALAVAGGIVATIAVRWRLRAVLAP